MSRLRDKRTRHDRFYKRAKKEQYASRAVYKLAEIDKRFKLLRPGGRVLDLGCWPGSWSQYCAEQVGPSGAVVGIDRNPVEIALPPQVRTLRGNVFEVEPATLLGDLEAFDAVISDMAPDTTGIRFTDVTRSVDLVERALALADAVSGPDSIFLAKIFVGPGFDELLTQLKSRYRKVKTVKPDSTRSGSMEQYMVGREKRPL
jgi:23S rRNA (uridine2552-2'-O)-methyltransferase